MPSAAPSAWLRDAARSATATPTVSGPGSSLSRSSRTGDVLRLGLGPGKTARSQDRHRNQVGVDGLVVRTAASLHPEHPDRRRPGEQHDPVRAQGIDDRVLHPRLERCEDEGRIPVEVVPGVDHQPAADLEVERLEEFVEPGGLRVAQQEQDRPALIRERPELGAARRV